MSKTPHEIRLDILKMALESEFIRYNTECEVVRSNWQVALDSARDEHRNLPILSGLPEFPSEKAIIDRAKFFSKFVGL
jgi:hypothetical protein